LSHIIRPSIHIPVVATAIGIVLTVDGLQGIGGDVLDRVAGEPRSGKGLCVFFLFTTSTCRKKKELKKYNEDEQDEDKEDEKGVFIHRM